MIKKLLLQKTKKNNYLLSFYNNSFTNALIRPVAKIMQGVYSLVDNFCEAKNKLYQSIKKISCK